MIYGKKIVVVMPAYNAEKTLRQTYDEVDRSIVDEMILVDDCSSDQTKKVAQELGIKTIVHNNNLGYGGNQKTCYTAALQTGADIVVMVHPDYQYTPKLIPSMAYMIATGEYDCILASRILGGTALKGGMPLYKYIFNRFLTAFENICLRQKISEYHTGYRAFSKKLLESLPLAECDDDFVFDNEMLGQICYFGFRIGEVSCPTKYFEEASSINFSRSVKYGFGVLRVSLSYVLAKLGLAHPKIFARNGKKVTELPSRGYVY
jgi:glycosyltransferase involved in cell wall biosynthesis